MDDAPHKVGDVWVTEGNDGEPVYAKVTRVEPPITDPTQPGFGGDWRISLNGAGLTHVGWWYGQGWSELEDE